MFIIHLLSFILNASFYVIVLLAAKKDINSFKRRIIFVVPFIPFIVFETQFAQISTNVIPVHVLMEKSVLME